MKSGALLRNGRSPARKRKLNEKNAAKQRSGNAHAPSGGSGKREAISTGDETMKIGMDIGAERQCPCPLWGLQVIASAITCGG